jgi:serine/threonine protein kinase
MAVLEQIRNHVPASPQSVNPRVSSTVSNLIERLLAKDPSDRIQTASQVHEILEQYLAHLHHPTARNIPVVEALIPASRNSTKEGSHSVGRNRKRRRTLWVGGVGISLATLAMVAWAFMSGLMGSSSGGSEGPDMADGIFQGGMPTPDSADGNLVHALSLSKLPKDMLPSNQLAQQVQGLGREVGELEQLLSGFWLSPDLVEGEVEGDSLEQQFLELDLDLQHVELLDW